MSIVQEWSRTINSTTRSVRHPGYAVVMNIFLYNPFVRNISFQGFWLLHVILSLATFTVVTYVDNKNMRYVRRLLRIRRTLSTMNITKRRRRKKTEEIGRMTCLEYSSTFTFTVPAISYTTLWLNPFVLRTLTVFRAGRFATTRTLSTPAIMHARYLLKSFDHLVYATTTRRRSPFSRIFFAVLTSSVIVFLANIRTLFLRERRLK